jgi:hypothetical protein
MAEASDQNGSDCEERKLGEQNGLDRDFCQKSRKKQLSGMLLRKSHELVSIFAIKITVEINFVLFMAEYLLITRVVLAVNAVSKVLRTPRGCAVSKRSR